MSERDQERERREGEPYQVVISDLRHRRDADEEAQEDAESGAAQQSDIAPEPAAAPEPAPAQEPVASEVEPVAADSTPPALQQPEPIEFPQAEEDFEAGPGEEPSAEQVSASEMAYLRQVFAAGLPNYLRGQLGLLLNFALLALGRAPDPATGLVAKNLPHARLAIDLLEFIIARLEPELEPAERIQMKALVSDLKYAYMQATGAAPPAAPPQ